MGDGSIVGRASSLLSLAAAPAFAIMALLTAADGEGPAAILCSAAHGSSPLGGMVLMYVLMSVFHSTPWLRLISSGGMRGRTTI
jgi:hypothetical protein